ncbi:MAG: TonB-dependent receptor [Burkholderiaceae bacterium]|nr:TonB-dependent receptor [Burkholderiaceae bacterium]
MTHSRSTSRPWQRHAIAIATSTFVLALSGLQGANAQSNITGTVYGSVQPGGGVTILVENTATGLKRTVTPDSTGRFSASSLPPGTYRATQLRNGQAVGAASMVEVLLGQGSEVVFGGTQVVTVTGASRRLDMSAVSNGAIFTAKQLDALPIAQNLDAIIQLAPNTTKADPRYSGGASIGGGAPSENSYYINGFPVTNALNQLGSIELPFNSIAQANVASGGFGAEFGRSVGGVISLVTKSGGNKWEAGVSASTSPKSLRSDYDNIYLTDGTLFVNNADRKRSESQIGAYVGGPILEDKLFVFAAVEQLKNTVERQSQLGDQFVNGFLDNGWAVRKNTNDRYLLKFDWNLTRNHLLEFTSLGDEYTQNETVSGYNLLTGVRDGITAAKAKFVNQSDHTDGVGGKANILKYTGFLTDDLTLSALVGRSQSPHSNSYDGVDVYSQVRQVRADTANRYPGFTYNNPYPFAPGTLVLAPGSKDKVDAYRFDLEYKLGSHLLRAGIDKVSLQSKNAGDVLAGNGLYRYFRTTNAALKPNGATTAVGAGAGVLTQPNAAGTTAANSTYYYYGYEQIFETTTNAESNQSAIYLEDKWQVNKQLTVTPGIRVEKYSNVNGDGEKFLTVKTQLHPRLQFSYDVFNDGRTKLYGSAGRYGVQIPTHLAVRGASRSTFTRQPFVYTGVDANGVPIGRADLGTPFSSNNEYGQAKDAKTVAAQDIKPNSQDELTLGIERALSNKLNVGVKATYRSLVATIDDLCDPRPFQAYATRNNIDTTNWAGFGCASFNPGKGNTFLIDFAGNGTYTAVNLTAAELGFQKAKRTYFALDFFAEHPFSDGWYGKVTYTYAKNKGNTEGQTLSDVAQTDVAATQTWDHPELMDGAYGYLPNDRRHQIKAYGYMAVTPQIIVGANALLASGRPKNCIGNFAGTPSFGTSPADFDSDYSYGSSYRYCSFDGVTSVPTPRGNQGTLPWEYRLDMNLAYRPAQVKGLQFKVDVFNLFNRQSAQAIDEVHEDAGDITAVLPRYGRIIQNTAPRSVKLTVSYDHKF